MLVAPCLTYPQGFLMLLVQHLGHVVLLLLLDPEVRHVIPARSQLGVGWGQPMVGARGLAPISINNPQPVHDPSPEDLFLLADNLLQFLNLILLAIKYIFLLYNVRLNFCGGERQGGGGSIPQAPS